MRRVPRREAYCQRLGKLWLCVVAELGWDVQRDCIYSPDDTMPFRINCPYRTGLECANKQAHHELKSLQDGGY